jgi:hypothetical protein
LQTFAAFHLAVTGAGLLMAGGILAMAGRLLPMRRWALSAIEHLFDVRQAQGRTTPTYDIVGHSAGGQSCIALCSSSRTRGFVAR